MSGQEPFVWKCLRTGVQAFDYYIAPEIAEWFLNGAERNLEVWSWHKKVGRVEVLLPNGKWVTANRKNEQWADKTYDNLAMSVAAENVEIIRGQEARDRYRVDADERNAEHAGLRGIMLLSPSSEDLVARTK